MQEELIEKLIGVEKEARQLKSEAEDEIDKLKDKYQKRISREKKLRLEEAENDGKRLVEEMTEEAVKYADRLEKEREKELKENENKYKEVKDSLLEKYFKKIIQNKGE